MEKARLWMTLLILMTPTLVEANLIDLHGVGASFPAEVYRSWRPTFEYARDSWVKLRMSYDEQNSAAGKRLVMDRTVHYGASDAELTQEEMDNFPQMQMVPVIAG
jgi:ABC-type phosphate transport system substrate-binding protein